ncbi:MAG: phosphoadenylyl-sulfate reductase, partial [Hyphococcus sp.]
NPETTVKRSELVMTAQIISLPPKPDAGGASLLELRARSLAKRFSESDAHAILSRAIKHEFAGRIALVSSFGAEAAALLHLVSTIDPAIPVIFLDTEKHFAQTLSYRKKLAAQLGLSTVIAVKPSAEAVAARDDSGDLWKHDPDACCTLRKVEPLTDALRPFDAWITGRKQFHGGGRVNLPAFEANETHIKVNPLIRWSREDVADYVAAHDLPPHPLVQQGYPSIGCWPCTHPVADGDDVRAGRWRGAAKTECGIHGRTAP